MLTKTEVPFGKLESLLLTLQWVKFVIALNMSYEE